MVNESPPLLYVGIDWSKEKHDACFMDAGGKVIGKKVFEHTGTGLAQLVAWIVSFGCELGRVAAGIEIPFGPVVDVLLEKGIRVFSINPKQLDRFRDRFSPAGAKDDSWDCEVLASALRTDPQAFRRLQIESATLVELREVSRARDEITEDVTRTTNRLGEQLNRFFPQMLKVVDDLSAAWVLDLLTLMPTPERAQSISEEALTEFLKQHRIRKHAAKDLLAALRAPAVAAAPGVIEGCCARVEFLLARLRLLNGQAYTVEKRLSQLVNRWQDEHAAEEAKEGSGPAEKPGVAEILLSLPGFGKITLATLLANAARPLLAQDYQAFRTLSGIAPVTDASGKRRGKSARVFMRRACDARLRNALFHWSRAASNQEGRFKEEYAVLRKRGHSYGRALRTIAEHLLRVAFAMLKSRTLYDPAARPHTKAS